MVMMIVVVRTVLYTIRLSIYKDGSASVSGGGGGCVGVGGWGRAW